MNKQEVIEKIEGKRTGCDDTIWGGAYDEAIDDASAIVRQLDEPEKPVVPQFVADWYEKNEYSLERNIYTLCIRSYQRELPKEEFSKWFDDVRNKAIETLVKMKLYGYEVEKEKLYTVEIPSPNCSTDDHYILSRLKNGKIIVNRYCIAQWKKFGDCQLTESEIKQDFDWAWQFAKEVEE